MSTQTNKKRPAEKPIDNAKPALQKTSRTTRILENVELLVSLCQRQAADSQKGEVTESFNKIEQQLDVKSTDIIQAVEELLDQRLNSLDQRVTNLAASVGQWNDSPEDRASEHDYSGLLQKQRQDLEASIGRFADHLDEKTDRILENVRSYSEIENRANPELDDTLSKFGDELNQIRTLLKNPSPTEGSPLASQQLADQLENAIKELSETLQVQLEDQFERRFEKLNATVEKITAVIAGQQALLESGNQLGVGSGEPDAALLDQIEQKIEGVFLCFNTRIDDLFGSLGDRISQLSENIARQDTGTESSVVEEQEEDSASHWHRQKTAMLSKYGIDPDYRPVIDSPSEPVQQEESEPSVDELEEATENLESLHNSIENMSAADAEAIENLKEELTSKLRDAEVEFSINRAKLSQLKAELDDRQVELERRAAALEEKYGDSDSEIKSGFLDRLTRHLSLRKSRELGEQS